MPVDLNSISPTVDAHLDRHAVRRRERLPTASSLVGPVDAAVFAWRRWTAAAGLRPVLHTFDDAGAVAPALLADLASAYDLAALAHLHLRRSAGLPPADAGSPFVGTARDIDQLAAAATSADPVGAGRVAHALLRSMGTAFSANAVAEIDAALSPGRGPPRWRVLRAVDALLPPHARPAILFLPPTADDAATAQWLATVAADVACLTEAVPEWCVGICCPATAFEQFRRGAPPSRAKSLMLAGEVRLEVPVSAALAALVGPGAHELPHLEGAIDGLAAGGATEALADAFADAARLRPQRDDGARSAAERFLFELLESHPRTAGRFVLNGDAGFRFGRRPAEVDLLAAGLRLAVEVDGYHHFTEAGAYRRDRRKDWLLQRHGYAVVRVLADDVVARTQDVLDTILTAVDHCLQTNAGVAQP